MKVFKFGGASVKDAEGVKNAKDILLRYSGQQIIVVVSAMGKMTNAFEKIVDAYFNSPSGLRSLINSVKDFHFNILENLSLQNDEQLKGDIENSFTEIDWIVEENQDKGYGFTYDQVVPHGELMSSKILSAFLKQQGISNTWVDIRDIIHTDNNYREGNVDWELTEKLCRQKLPQLLEQNKLIITQGFIASTSENFTTTLGREGSDYTAAILSYCLDAEEMLVWKDVTGVLSADPKHSSEAIRLDQISYHDAIELTYYGATVIHPKTIKPLENKNIPLRVCSFLSLNESGTSIGNFQGTKPLVPCFIYKFNQILFSISSKDFSFIAEESLSRIFRLFADHSVKINLMQNSAVSFSVCVDNDIHRIPQLYEELNKEFRVLYNDNLKLITVRHYYPSTIEMMTKGKIILLEQRSRQTAQVVLKDDSTPAQ